MGVGEKKIWPSNEEREKSDKQWEYQTEFFCVGSSDFGFKSQNHDLNPMYQTAPRTWVVCNTNTVTPNAKTDGPYALLWWRIW
jgi:hypothetical protein